MVSRMTWIDESVGVAVPVICLIPLNSSRMVVPRSPADPMCLPSHLFSGGHVLANGSAVGLFYFLRVILVVGSQRQTVSNEGPKKGTLDSSFEGGVGADA